MSDATTGLLLLVAGGVMNAGFSLPMKSAHKWAWENTWLVWTIFALLILPTLAVTVFIPAPMEVYQHAGIAIFSKVAVFGFGWGIAQVLFGLAIDAIGIALAFSVVLGLSAAAGGLIPLFWLHHEDVFRPEGLAILLGTGLVIVGLIFCGIAGHKREKQEKYLSRSRGEPRISVARGFILAVLSGLFAAFMNFGVAFGGPLLQSAIEQGANNSTAMNVVWWPLLAAGAIPNTIYCVFLLKKNRSYTKFSALNSRFHWLLGLLMAALWLGSTLIYGIASHKLGPLGPSLGWPLFMSVIVISANGLGIVTGEWKNAGKVALRIQAVGMAFLVLAVIALSRHSS